MTDTPCLLCTRPLHPTEIRTCLACLGRTRRQLQTIAALHALLPALLARHDGATLGAVMGGRTDEAALPGGDLLAMLAPGSDGSRARPAGDDGTRWIRAYWCHLCGGQTTDPSRHLYDHGETTWSRIPDLFSDAGWIDRPEPTPAMRPSDPPAVAFELWQWTVDWAETRDEPVPGSRVETTVPWLTKRTGWALAHHDAADEFAADMERIVTRLEVATGMHDRPEKGPPCPYCRTADLLRPYTDTGLADEWTCPACRREFNYAQYVLATRASLEEAQAG